MQGEIQADVTVRKNSDCIPRGIRPGKRDSRHTCALSHHGEDGSHSFPPLPKRRRRNAQRQHSINSQPTTKPSKASRQTILRCVPSSLLLPLRAEEEPVRPRSTGVKTSEADLALARGKPLADWRGKETAAWRLLIGVVCCKSLAPVPVFRWLHTEKRRVQVGPMVMPSLAQGFRYSLRGPQITSGRIGIHGTVR